MGHVLSAPVSSKMCERHGSETMRVGTAEMQGFRVHMEDQMTIKTALNSKKHNGLSFFSVFDGHGGPRASEFMKHRLWREVAALDTPTDQKKLGAVVQNLDVEFCSVAERREHGTTCCFALVQEIGGTEKKSKKKSKKKKKKKTSDADAAPGAKKKTKKKYAITVGNVGDSRAILIKADGKLLSLTSDHKPELPAEEARIQAAGGFCRAGRVDGQLAMSRAIGDYKYKDDSTLTLIKQKVIATADFATAEAVPGDFLLLYCDGIVEQMTNEEVAEYVNKELAEGKAGERDPVKIMQGLLELSLKLGSKDNMSAMMICFEDGMSYASEPQFYPGPYHQHKHDEAFSRAYLEDAAKWGYEGEKLLALIPSPPDGYGQTSSDEDGGAMSLGEGGGAAGDGVLKTLLQNLVSNLNRPGQSKEEKAQALMNILKGARLQMEGDEEDGEEGEGDTVMMTESMEVREETSIEEDLS